MQFDVAQLIYQEKTIDMVLPVEHEGYSIAGTIREGMFYEHEILEHLHEFHKKQGVVIDAGANIGNHIVFYANFLECDAIYGFEPLPQIYPVLQENCKNLDNVFISPNGLWSSETLGEVHRYQIEPGCTSVSPGGISGVNIIPMVTIDSLGLENVTLIKLDVEGPELEILKGGEATIRRDLPLLLVECGGGNAHFPVLSVEIYSLLASWGYKETAAWYGYMPEFGIIGKHHDAV